MNQKKRKTSDSIQNVVSNKITINFSPSSVTNEKKD